MVLSMDRWVGKVAVVTGASAGIGAKIAERLVQEGVTVVGIARRKVKLEILARNIPQAKGKLIAAQADLTKEQDIVDAFKWIRENVGPIHILINNAGIGSFADILHGKTEDWKTMLDTNILALSVCTREAIANMKENKIDGHIVNIGSVLGHVVVPVPAFSMYTATKHAVTALAEAIRLELANDKSSIKITNISPGLVATSMADKTLLDRMSHLQTDDVAEGVVYVLSTPPHAQVHELMIRAVE